MNHELWSCVAYGCLGETSDGAPIIRSSASRLIGNSVTAGFPHRTKASQCGRCRAALLSDGVRRDL